MTDSKKSTFLLQVSLGLSKLVCCTTRVLRPPRGTEDLVLPPDPEAVPPELAALPAPSMRLWGGDMVKPFDTCCPEPELEFFCAFSSRPSASISLPFSCWASSSSAANFSISLSLSVSLSPLSADNMLVIIISLDSIVLRWCCWCWRSGYGCIEVFTNSERNVALQSKMEPIRGTEGLGGVREWCSSGWEQIWHMGKKGIVRPGQVKETSKRRAELKEERGARMRGGLC